MSFVPTHIDWKGSQSPSPLEVSSIETKGRTPVDLQKENGKCHIDEEVGHLGSRRYTRTYPVKRNGHIAHVHIQQRIHTYTPTNVYTGTQVQGMKELLELTYE